MGGAPAVTGDGSSTPEPTEEEARAVLSREAAKVLLSMGVNFTFVTDGDIEDYTESELLQLGRGLARAEGRLESFGPREDLRIVGESLDLVMREIRARRSDGMR